MLRRAVFGLVSTGVIGFAVAANSACDNFGDGVQ